MAMKEIKLCLLGESGVGKSSIVLRFVRDQYQENLESTIGASFMTKRLTLNDQTYVFQIWDTAGQEKYRALAPMYYRGAAAAIVVYDVTRESSYPAVQHWVKELQNIASSKIVIAIAGNKCDLEDLREVSTQSARQYAKDIGAIFTETSALSSINIQQLFEDIAKQIPIDDMSSVSRGSNVNVNDRQGQSGEKRDCCSRQKQEGVL